MKTIKVTQKELTDFILAQPPEKELDFDIPNTLAKTLENSNCGCLFYEYAASLEKEEKHISCGTDIASVFDTKGMNQEKLYKFPCYFSAFGGNHTNFGTLQESVREQSCV